MTYIKFDGGSSSAAEREREGKKWKESVCIFIYFAPVWLCFSNWTAESMPIIMNCSQHIFSQASAMARLAGWISCIYSKMSNYHPKVSHANRFASIQCTMYLQRNGGEAKSLHLHCFGSKTCFTKEEKKKEEKKSVEKKETATTHTHQRKKTIIKYETLAAVFLMPFRLNWLNRDKYLFRIAHSLQQFFWWKMPTKLSP